MNQTELMEMRKWMDTMEDTIKLQNRANAERRAKKAEQEQKEFEKKLMRAAASKAELEGLASKIEGSDNAVLRDQLVNLVSSTASLKDSPISFSET